MFHMQVIYGDTDSIMIYSGLDDIKKAKAIAGKVIQEVMLYDVLHIHGMKDRILLEDQSAVKNQGRTDL